MAVHAELVGGVALGAKELVRAGAVGVGVQEGGGTRELVRCRRWFNRCGVGAGWGSRGHRGSRCGVVVGAGVVTWCCQNVGVSAVAATSCVCLAVGLGLVAKQLEFRRLQRL